MVSLTEKLQGTLLYWFHRSCTGIFACKTFGVSESLDVFGMWKFMSFFFATPILGKPQRDALFRVGNGSSTHLESPLLKESKALRITRYCIPGSEERELSH